MDHFKNELNQTHTYCY